MDSCQNRCIETLAGRIPACCVNCPRGDQWSTATVGQCIRSPDAQCARNAKAKRGARGGAEVTNRSDISCDRSVCDFCKFAIRLAPCHCRYGQQPKRQPHKEQSGGTRPATMRTDRRRLGLALVGVWVFVFVALVDRGHIGPLEPGPDKLEFELGPDRGAPGHRGGRLSMLHANAAQVTATPNATVTATPHETVTTANPTKLPTAHPTTNPTKLPTANPTANPTALPTGPPTANPTINPTANPTANPHTARTVVLRGLRCSCVHCVS